VAQNMSVERVEFFAINECAIATVQISDVQTIACAINNGVNA